MYPYKITKYKNVGGKPMLVKEHVHKNCENCGKRFQQWRPQQIYCSTNCRVKVFREKQKEKLAKAERLIQKYGNK
jgi:hypothetical protein